MDRPYFYLHQMTKIAGMVRFITLLISAAVMVSCGGSYHIDGKSSSSHFDGKMAYLRMLDDAGTVVDSAEIVHGTFKMSGDIDSVMMLMLYMDDACVAPLVLEDGDLSVDISYADATVSGTHLNDSLYAFLKRKRNYDNEFSRMDSEIARRVLDGDNYDAVKAEVGNECDRLCADYYDYIEDFITSNYDNVLSSGVFLLICRSTPEGALPDSFFSIFDDAPATFKAQPALAGYFAAQGVR